MISTKALKKEKTTFFKNFLVTKKQLIGQSNRLDRFFFNKAGFITNFNTSLKKKTNQVSQSAYLITPSFFNFIYKTETMSLATLASFYFSFKLYRNKSALLTKRNIVSTLCKLKLATIGTSQGTSLQSNLLKNTTSDLQTFQTLNDYFFAPSFYTSINKKSR